MAQVFISYSSLDTKAARTLKERLERAHVSVFLACDSLNAGDKWKDEVLHGLRAAKLVFVLVSEASSKSAAVMHEIGGALVREKEIVPILLDCCADMLPKWLSDRQALSWESFDEGALQKVIERALGQHALRALIVVGAVLAVLASSKRTETPEDALLHVLQEHIGALSRTVASLRKSFPNKQFTLDGRLVGDIGESIAELKYDVVTFKKIRRDFDGVTSDGRLVQIKASFRDAFTFKNRRGYLLALHLKADGSYREVYNGPAIRVYRRYRNRLGIGDKLLSFPVSVFEELSADVAPEERIPLRHTQNA